ncbi:helix-turn-helix transcriptional regulator [Streptomyces decoyicus]
MKFDRLLSIVLLLQHRDLVLAKELAERLEVSQRTIYRDVEALSAAGVPVYAERGKNGGIGLLAGFRTDVTGLTTDEARALFVLASQSAHSALGLDHALGSALRKVMAALPAPHRPVAELTRRRILVEPDRWHAAPRPDSDLEALYAAVLSDRRLRVRYRHSGQTALRTYTVDPYGLVAKAGTWYLVADHKGKPRLLRTDRLSRVSVLEAEAHRRSAVELTQVWHDLRRPRPARRWPAPSPSWPDSTTLPEPRLRGCTASRLGPGSFGGPVTAGRGRSPVGCQPDLGRRNRPRAIVLGRTPAEDRRPTASAAVHRHCPRHRRPGRASRQPSLLSRVTAGGVRNGRG